MALGCGDIQPLIVIKVLHCIAYSQYCSRQWINEDLLFNYKVRANILTNCLRVVACLAVGRATLLSSARGAVFAASGAANCPEVRDRPVPPAFICGCTLVSVPCKAHCFRVRYSCKNTLIYHYHHKDTCRKAAEPLGPQDTNFKTVYAECPRNPEAKQLRL